ncbi:DUF2092 domain-containing protein [Sulfurovum sp. NBC37-1]|uniref:DUF2092 domain-containing protein n=1 Tax=Sulfurovum sp. (strain NBC37-1) TaxID=387093 RepID=UPI0001587D79|nr:DUF2092 domain-containing protein [Sulfurovum sp. NBC37-1]BAF72932.1 hypothetical protein SUN_1989 [Sulfurovum sp. NBC37-1]
MKRMLYYLLILQMGTTILFAAGPKGESGAKTLYPLPSAIIMNAYRYLGKLQHFSIDAVTTNDDEFQGKMLVTYTHWVHIDLQRPGRLHISVDGDLKERSFYLDHGRFAIYDKVLGYYGTLNLPQNIDAALDDLFEQYDIKTALANVLYSDLYRRIPPKQEGYYFGLSDVDDIVCHHIGFANDVQEIQFWVEKGKRPLIRKFIVTDKTEKLLPRSGTILHWNLTPKFGEKTFTFIPPENAREIPIESQTGKEKR